MRTIQALSAASQPVQVDVDIERSDRGEFASSDDPPVMTAVAAGHVTITAGAASADVTVFADALTLGTVLWSNPGNASGVTKIVPAVPTANGVADVFAFQGDGTVQAITSDGATAWTADVSGALNWGQAVPDFQGGLVVMDLNANSIVKLDGITGQRYSAYTPGGNWELDDALAVHTDGTIFVIQHDNQSRAVSVIGIDPTTGAKKFSVPLDMPAGSSDLYAHGIIIAGDCYAYVPFEYREDPYFTPSFNHLRLLRVNSSGASDNIDILDWTAGGTELPPWRPVNMITNADTGIMLSWSTWDGTPTGLLGMATTAGTSASIISAPQLPGQIDAVVPVLQAQDGSFVGTAWTGEYGDVPYMVAFDAGGNVRWSVPDEQPQIVTDDGGVIGQSGITYDQNGNATGQMGLPTYSWTGNAYQQQGSVEQISADLLFVLYDVASSFWAVAGGNYSGNGTAYSLIRTFSDNEVSSDIIVAPFSQTGANQQTITNVLNDILQGLNSGRYASCSTWLTGRAPFSISAYIPYLISNNAYGHGPFSDNGTAAFVGTRNIDGSFTGVPASVAIAVNDTGAFFNAKVGDKTFTVGRRSYTGGTLKAQAAILLHELGHTMNEVGGAAGFQADAGKKVAGHSNDKLVDQYCRKLIGDLK